VVARVQMFYERFLKVEEQLDRTRKAFDDVRTVTATSGQSIEVAARKLIKYGAQSSAKRKYQLKTADTPLLEQEEED
ncbi:MAG: DNA recombination protein RmuC, partial [Prevotella sp.]|nr:DNA recombination protein RmuC [Prevotella sp.]